MKLQNYARRYMEGFTKTTNLTKLEDMLETKGRDGRYEYAVGAYLSLTEKNLNKYKHSKLLELKNEFEKAMKQKDMNNKYYETLVSLEALASSRQNNEDYKKRLREQTMANLNELDLSFNYLLTEYNKKSKGKETKYSNAYNFFFKKDYSKLTRDDATNFFVFLKGMLNE